MTPEQEKAARERMSSAVGYSVYAPEAVAKGLVNDLAIALAALDEARTALTLERETSAALAEQCRGLAETLRSVTAERTEARRERDEALKAYAATWALLDRIAYERELPDDEAAWLYTGQPKAVWDALRAAGIAPRALLPEPGQ